MTAVTREPVPRRWSLARTSLSRALILLALVQIQPELTHGDNGNAKQVPDRLYKYRHFDDVTLEALVDDTVYFADPTRFNDPLDSRPSLE